MIKYTPGPWQFYTDWETKTPIAVVSNAEQPKDRRTIVRVDRPSVGKWDDEIINGNAKLIRAAPDLLHALENLVTLKDYKDEMGKDESYEKLKVVAWDKARAALKRVHEPYKP